STRCRFIPAEGDPCPGVIEKCKHLQGGEACGEACGDNGGTSVTVRFAPAGAKENAND
ncbi:MAG: hypothetical protein GY859_26370, partial [Desulfobacterales bacterium]|nr:hypothetical protein [Desulfobacterales bacterium]